MGDLPQFLEGIKTLLSDSSTESLAGYNILVSLVTIVLIFFLEEKLVDKANNRKFSGLRLTTLTIISLAVSIVFQLIFSFVSRNLIVTFAISTLSSIATLFFYRKFFESSKSDKSSNDNNEKKDKSKELPDNLKYSDLNILDILEIFGYISEVQKHRILSYSAIETPEQMADKFLTMSVITAQDYLEAKMLLRIATTERRLATRDEVKKILKDNNGNTIIRD